MQIEAHHSPLLTEPHSAPGVLQEAVHDQTVLSIHSGFVGRLLRAKHYTGPKWGQQQEVHKTKQIRDGCSGLPGCARPPTPSGPFPLHVLLRFLSASARAPGPLCPPLLPVHP